LVYTQVHIDASGLLIAHNGMMGLLLMLLLVLPIIYTLSNATVSVHVVKSPNMRNPESCDNTCMNSHLLGPVREAREVRDVCIEVVVSWETLCQIDVSVNSILKDAMLFFIGLLGIG
jgi:hypothetical protein